MNIPKNKYDDTNNVRKQIMNGNYKSSNVSQSYVSRSINARIESDGIKYNLSYKASCLSDYRKVVTALLSSSKVVIPVGSNEYLTIKQIQW